MAGGERLQQLRVLVSRLERGGQDARAIHGDFVSLAAKYWPDEEDDDDEENSDESQTFLRLEELLLQLPAVEQEAIVGAFRPLRAEVSRRLAEWTLEVNDWLSEAGQAKQPAQPQHLGELLREVESSPQSRWYRQCPDMRVKAKFLLAIASLSRALIGGSSLLKPLAASHPSLFALAKKLSSRLFVLPVLGDILETWHEGRLACYNATLSLAAERAADKLKDDLQVSLVSALKRSASQPAQQTPAPGKAKPPLQIELKDWPMSGCPLARALLEFLLQRRSELGNLGRPSLRECPPHTLKPSTLRQLLSKLDAFEIVDGSGAGGSIVRLRWEAVAALAFKAVGTKPKAGSVLPATPAPKSASGPLAKPSAEKATGEASHAGAAADAARAADGQKPQGTTAVPGAEGDVAAFASASLEKKIDFSDAKALMQLVRGGLRFGDEEWRQSWTQFCWQRNISTRLSSRGPLAAPREALAAFVEQQLPKLKKSDWAEQLLNQTAGASDEAQETLLDSGAGGRASTGERSLQRSAPNRGATGTSAAGVKAGQRRHLSSSRRGDSESDCSSSCYDSDRSNRRRKRRRKDIKKPGGMMGYADFFGKSKSKLGMSPEVMMMRAQMMGVSMVMNSPLAMMGMRNPMMNSMVPSRPHSDGAPWQQQQQSSSQPPPPPPPPPPPAPQLSLTAGPSSGPKAPGPMSAQAPAPKGASRKNEPTIDMDDL